MHCPSHWGTFLGCYVTRTNCGVRAGAHKVGAEPDSAAAVSGIQTLGFWPQCGDVSSDHRVTMRIAVRPGRATSEAIRTMYFQIGGRVMPPPPPAWLYKSKITHCKKFIKYLKVWKEVDKSHQ